MLTLGNFKIMAKNFSKIDNRVVSHRLGLFGCMRDLLISPSNFPSVDSAETYAGELCFFSKAAENPAAQI